MTEVAIKKSDIGSASDIHVSDDMKQQLKSIAASRQRVGDQESRPDFNIVTFDSDLERAVPDPGVMWEKATCC